MGPSKLRLGSPAGRVADQCRDDFAGLFSAGLRDALETERLLAAHDHLDRDGAVRRRLDDLHVVRIDVRELVVEIAGLGSGVSLVSAMLTAF